MITAARAMHRSYVKGGKRAGQVTRLHVIRDTPIRSHSPGWPGSAAGRSGDPGAQTWCGQSAGTHRNSEPVILSPMPQRPPEGLTWCPSCIGHLAEHFGLLAEVAASVAAYDPGLA